ncbi:MAG: hypothetical protein ACUVTL_08700 [Thermoproteota archaeon]
MQEEYQQINVLRQKVASLKKAMATSKEEFRRLLDKKEDLLEKAAKIKVEADAALDQRDTINKEVQNLKKRIDDVVKEESNIKSEIEKKEKELEEAKSKLKGNEYELDRKMRDLEWRLITGGVSAEEEAEIVSSIAGLHQKLAAYERVKRIDVELKKLKKRSTEVKAELIKLLEGKRKLVEESRGFHESFIRSMEKRKDVLEEVADVRNQIKELKAQMEERFMELVKLNAEISLYESRIVKEREDKKKEKQRLEEEAKDRVARSAAEKLRRGESISWDEFKIYLERNLKG